MAYLGCSNDPEGTSVKLPGGSPGIGFDDLRYSTSLHRLLVPAGRSGRLDLVDPNTLSVEAVEGFSTNAEYSGGHDEGPTSVDEGLGKLFVTDRTSGNLLVVDPALLSITGSVPLGGPPDYIRFVAATNELWVTEPGAGQIEIFKLGADGVPVRDATVPVENGPESLVIDAKRGRAYTHRWQRTTVAIDVATRSLVAEWSNGCAASRGIAVDEEHGWLFSGCNEGTVAIIDANHEGEILSTSERGSGFDVIGYNASLRHLYLAGSSCACFIVLGVTTSAQLTFLYRSAAPGRTHCAVADDVDHAWVCDPDAGQLWRIMDPSPSPLP